jgi:hypothetical protein
MSVTKSVSPRITMPLGALRVTSGEAPSIHRTSNPVPSGWKREMNPLPSGASAAPLTFETR